MNFLILRLSSLGDIVLTQPVTKLLRERYPAARIDYLTKPAYREAVAAFGTIDNIYLHADEKKATFSDLRKVHYDILIDLQTKINTWIIKRKLHSKRILTCNKQHWRRWLLTKKVIRKSNQTMVNLYLHALRDLGINFHDIEPKIKPDEEQRKSVRRLLQQKNLDTGNRIISIFPGSLHPTKQYPPDRIAAFINSIPDDWNCSFLLLGSSAERALTLEIVELTDHRAVDMCGDLKLGQMIAMIAETDVVISGDTGPMHVAAALGKPQIAIFGATHPCLGFSPRNDKAVILSAELDCQPCSLHGSRKCPRGHFRCMLTLKPEQLRDKLKEQLNRYF
ncbi:MAG: glycosyltransferase family 9 protein [Candidatus Cloacimonetes bacterium]|nr:glycosyltransferase family 9 protein [Candidatus Cloacimonadota bacterium]